MENLNHDNKERVKNPKKVKKERNLKDKIKKIFKIH